MLLTSQWPNTFFSLENREIPVNNTCNYYSSPSNTRLGEEKRISVVVWASAIYSRAICSHVSNS